MMRWAVLTGMGVLALAGSAHATAFTSSTAFLAATSGLTTEDYASTTAGTLIADGGALDGLTYSFSTRGGLGGVITDHYYSFSGLSLGAKQASGPLTNADFFYGGDSFTITFAHPETAVGIFANVNLNSGTYTLSAGSDTATTDSLVDDTNTFVFVGLTSATPFTSVTFRSNDTSLGSYNIPEILYGGTSNAVPEPMSLALLGLGTLGLAVVRRRRA